MDGLTLINNTLSLRLLSNFDIMKVQIKGEHRTFRNTSHNLESISRRVVCCLPPKTSKSTLLLMDSNYELLIDECKQILTEYGFLSRWDHVTGMHLLGSRVLSENDNLERKEIYGQSIVKNLSTALGMSERTLQYAIQFAQKFPDLDMLPEGKNVSWSRIIREYLPETKQAPPEYEVCPTCGAKKRITA